MSTKIDFSIWVTQQSLANELGIAVQNVHNWINRGKIEAREHEFIPGVKVFLVNKNTIKVDSQRFGRYRKK